MKSFVFRLLVFSLLLVIPGFVLLSCDSDDENESLVSKVGTLKSHNIGQNCMTCHTSGGTGEGVFVIAGTVYDSNGVNPNPNGVIKLYRDANGSGTLLKSVEVDGKGNFYTTESFNFTGTVYPSVTGFSGNVKYMPTAVTTGQCNNCHGATAPKIWVK